MEVQRVDSIQGTSSNALTGELDRAVVEAAQAGDGGAFRALYDTYRDRVHSMVAYSVGDPTHTQDVLQTVFFKIFRGLGSFRFQSSLSTWIYRIAHNECQDHHRRRAAPHVPLEAILGSGDEIDGRAGSDAEHAQKERETIIRRALMQLPFKQREVVVMKYVEGLSYEEMSRVLGCAPGTVASRLNRALAALEERLRPFTGLL